MKLIPLTQDRVARIDDADYELATGDRWYAAHQGTSWYAMTNIRTPPGQPTTLRMHRLVMGARPGQELDHVNHNGLDNRRVNLRFCTSAENNQNRQKTRGSSRHKGVYWKKDKKMWAARIMHEGVFRYIGYFTGELSAAVAYDVVAEQTFGRFACLNVLKLRA